ncbi:MAG: ABC transporter permease subunit [Actinobacteria bacterium]|nr:ABC transporter permease subunit [Actinomycetota bacterium]
MIKALVLSELRQRIRGKRWWALLAIWTLILFGLTALVRNGAVGQQAFTPGPAPLGPVMFGSLALFVLGLACLVIPSLTSTAINSERDKGTLAVLQSTLFTARRILAAKFLGAMVVALAFLAATIPLALWCLSEGGASIGKVIVVYLLLILACALLVLLGLAASALIRKPSLSAVAAYAVVFLLTAGSPIIFGLSLLGAPEVAFERQIGWRWAILAPDPFIVLADAAPRSDDSVMISDPLNAIRDSVRDARRPPIRFDPQTGLPIDPRTGEPIDPNSGSFEVLFPEDEVEEPPALWPLGMAMQAGLALGAAAVVLKKLKIPAHRLAVGERVA